MILTEVRLSLFVPARYSGMFVIYNTNVSFKFSFVHRSTLVTLFQNLFYSSIKLLISFHRFFSLLRRMFKRLLDPKAEKRPVSVLEINKYLEDRWLAKLGAEKAMNGNDRSELKTFSSSRFPIHLVDSTFVQVAPTRGTSCARPCTASTALSRKRINCFTL